MRTSVPKPPEWVRKTRPKPEVLYDRTYNVPGQEPERAPMNAQQLRNVEAEMNALRSRHDRAAGRPAAAPAGSAAGPLKLNRKSGRAPCVLTCNIGLGSATRK